ncbi:hypothetical protein HYFRA_00012217 [Hymenoscyphus fraxineus]|uniref:Uncharacterized protein n=1 Tax=Hymenoscyphus fraxineus TaxID=746836 RepID=A0A9N9L1Q8_9HELO|nr:hypothetical protein HYFRA_00012217 [Hymenoscyphus fraxineus]
MESRNYPSVTRSVSIKLSGLSTIHVATNLPPQGEPLNRINPNAAPFTPSKSSGASKWRELPISFSKSCSGGRNNDLCTATFLAHARPLYGINSKHNTCKITCLAPLYSSSPIAYPAWKSGVTLPTNTAVTAKVSQRTGDKTHTTRIFARNPVDMRIYGTASEGVATQSNKRIAPLKWS